MKEKEVKGNKAPGPCPWPSRGMAPFSYHRVEMPRKVMRGGNWMEDRW